MPGEDPRIGTTIAGYRIDAVLGRGGMGVVYRAHQERLDRDAALKVIAPELTRDEGFRERFIGESRAAAAIEHPNVVPIYEADELDDGTLYLAMRFIDGTDLRRVISAEGGLDPVRAARIIEGVGAALDEAHVAGLVHRDVKPANVLIASFRGVEHPYLTDFGLTKRMTSAGGLTATGQWLGTIDYAAPEQIEGRRVDARTDVYSLGCVCFEALSGKLPFERDSDVAKLWAHVNDPPPPLRERVPGASGDLEAVVSRALAKDPAERFSSAGDLAGALWDAAHGHAPQVGDRIVATGAAAPTVAADTRRLPGDQAPPTAARPTDRLAPSGPAERARRPSPLLIGIGVLAALGAIGAVLVLGGVFDGSSGEQIADAPAGPAASGATTESESESAPTSTAGEAGAAGAGEQLDADAFTVEAPSGWRTVAVEQDAGNPVGSFQHTELESPDGDASLIIDRNPGDNRDPETRYEEISADLESSEGYRAISSGAESLGSREAFEWRFGTVEDGERLEKVDYLFNAGGDGYAVLGTARPGADPSEVQAAAKQAAATLEPSSSSPAAAAPTRPAPPAARTPRSRRRSPRPRGPDSRDHSACGPRPGWSGSRPRPGSRARRPS